MQDKLERQNLQATIKQCFVDIYDIVRADMKKNFKSDAKRGQKWDFARALVFLGDVAKNPEKYFAPEYTNAAWDKRVDEWIATSSLSEQRIKQYGIDYVRKVTKGSLAEPPFGIVYHKMESVFQDREFWNFCDKVQDFYYQDFFREVYVDKEYIKSYAKKIAGWARVAREHNFVKRNVAQFVHGGYKRQYNG